MLFILLEINNSAKWCYGPQEPQLATSRKLWCIQSTGNQSSDCCEWATSARAAAKAQIVAEVVARYYGTAAKAQIVAEVVAMVSVAVRVLVDKHRPQYKQ